MEANEKERVLSRVRHLFGMPWKRLEMEEQAHMRTLIRRGWAQFQFKNTRLMCVVEVES